ncbi:MAG: DNA-directed DNA polymerase I [Aigarchaeota archaeon]|nr:DNA-directed DNA polymerase I [Candidatus Calditenuaceae archaeon]
MQLSLDAALGGGDKLLLLSAGYDGDRGRAYLKLLRPSTGRVEVMYDDSGHLPYCYTDLPPRDVLESLRDLGESIVEVSEEEKFDALRLKKTRLAKIVVKDPLTVGGRKNSVRERIKTWESDIPYHLNYLYDRGLICGILYTASSNGLRPVTPSKDEAMRLALQIKKASKDDLSEIVNWIMMMEAELLDPPFCALDIEVYSPVSTRLPDPSKAEDPVIAVSICGSDGRREVLMLKRGDLKIDTSGLDFMALTYDSEEKMIEDVFNILSNYAIIATFNGDQFDLPYLYNRAKRLGIRNDKNKIVIGREGATFINAAHVDLYSFFLNRSIQVYAFDNKYREYTLEGISQALLGRGKIPIERPIAELSPRELATYSFGDAHLVYELLSNNERLIIRLILVLCRISRLPVEDLCRHGVSGWIKNLIYYEHRRRGWLIPRSDEILQEKGMTTTKAIIEGKKYRGAIVVDPMPGIHFGVKVLDFASLYPSALKRWNLSYETIRCPHEECRFNTVPETGHWVCTKRRGLQSQIIGSLRDIRVGIYKPRSSDPSVPREKRIWYDVIQKALKVFLNASYGVFGFEEFPLYCPPLAESTAAIGRYVFSEAIEKVRELGGTIIYGDTDSLFLKGADENQLKTLIKWADESLGLDLEVDKEYVYVVLSQRKKNYLGLTVKGVVDVKGLTGKKRHIFNLAHVLFERMIEDLKQIKRPEDFERFKLNLAGLIRESYNRLINREFEVSDLAFGVMLSKSPELYTKTTPPHVKAAQKLAAIGVKVGSGDIIQYVKTKDRLGVTPLHPRIEINKNQVDVEAYVEYLRGVFQQVLDSLDMDFDEIVSQGKSVKRTLDEFL